MTHDKGRITNIKGNKVTIQWEFNGPQTLEFDRPVAPEDWSLGGTVTWDEESESWKVSAPTVN